VKGGGDGDDCGDEDEDGNEDAHAHGYEDVHGYEDGYEDVHGYGTCTSSFSSRALETCVCRTHRVKTSPQAGPHTTHAAISCMLHAASHPLCDHARSSRGGTS